MDLKNAASLTPQQFEEDFEKPAQLSKNIHFVFYNARSEVRQPFLDRLEKMQNQFGADRVSLETAGMESLLQARSWRGELIHIGRGEETGPLFIRKPVYRFRYLKDEIHLVPAALLLVDQGDQGLRDRVMDLSMVGGILQSEIREYFAGLVIAHSA